MSMYRKEIEEEEEEEEEEETQSLTPAPSFHTCMAQVQVFNSFELLEMIFLQSTIRDVLRMQQTCKSWKSLIDNSPRIQEHLFFKSRARRPCRCGGSSSGSDSQKECQHGCGCEREDWRRNPLLEEVFPPWFTKPPIDYPERRLMNDWAPYVELETKKELAKLPWLSHSFWSWYKAITYSNASWRRMLVVQPLVKKLAIFHYHNTRGDPPGKAAELVKEGGIDMGTLFNVTIEFVLWRSSLLGSFLMRWHMFKSTEHYSDVIGVTGNTGTDCTKGLGDLAVDKIMVLHRITAENFSLRGLAWDDLGRWEDIDPQKSADPEDFMDD